MRKEEEDGQGVRRMLQRKTNCHLSLQLTTYLYACLYIYLCNVILLEVWKGINVTYMYKLKHNHRKNICKLTTS